MHRDALGAVLTNPKVLPDTNAVRFVHRVEDPDSHQNQTRIWPCPMKSMPCPKHDIESLSILIARKPEKSLAVSKPLRRPPGLKDIGFNAQRHVMHSSESRILQDLDTPVRRRHCQFVTVLENEPT